MSHNYFHKHFGALLLLGAMPGLGGCEDDGGQNLCPLEGKLVWSGETWKQTWDGWTVPSGMTSRVQRSKIGFHC